MITEIQSVMFEPQADWKPRLVFPALTGVKRFGFDLETKDPLLKDKGPGSIRKDGYPVGISFSLPGFKAYYPFAHELGGNLPKENVLNFFSDVLSKPELEYVGAHCLYDLEWLRFMGIKVKSKVKDVQIAEALIDEESDGGYSLDALCLKYLKRRKDDELLQMAASAYGLDPKIDLWKFNSKYVGQYAEADAADVLEIYAIQEKIISDRGLQGIFDLECELIEVLLEMRLQGVRVNLDKAAILAKDLSIQEEGLLKKLRSEIGFNMDVWSNKSIEKACKKAGYEYPRTLKGNASFDKIFLQNSTNPFFNQIRQIRTVNRLRCTYVEDLIFNYSINGRIHPTMKQMKQDEGGTVTGRFSCENPNLQQVPSRDKTIAKLIRALFIPEEGEKFAKLDYSQQELRVLTHYAYILKLRGASEMRDLYLNDKKTDFHMVTARISGLERKPAKDLGFGICYGEGKDKIARDLGRTVEQAMLILRKFNEAVPFITGLSERVMEQADRVGYIRTLLGRHRHFDFWEPVKAYDMKQRGQEVMPLKLEAAKAAWPGDRLKRAYTFKALNALIQGSSADMIKAAMVKVYKETKRVPLLQVHDELDYSVPGMFEATQIQYRMENAVECTVPILADLHLGEHWK